MKKKRQKGPPPLLTIGYKTRVAQHMYVFTVLLLILLMHFLKVVPYRWFFSYLIHLSLEAENFVSIKYKRYFRVIFI
jgi:hypothetical protein